MKLSSAHVSTAHVRAQHQMEYTIERLCVRLYTYANVCVQKTKYTLGFSLFMCSALGWSKTLHVSGP